MSCRLECVCSETKPGEEVAVIGATASLGRWDASKAVRLKTDAQAFPVWAVDLPCLPPDEEFKFVILSEGGGVRWEPLEGNRRWPREAVAGGGRISAAFGKASTSLSEPALGSTPEGVPAAAVSAPAGGLVEAATGAPPVETAAAPVAGAAPVPAAAPSPGAAPVEAMAPSTPAAPPCTAPAATPEEEAGLSRVGFAEAFGGCAAGEGSDPQAASNGQKLVKREQSLRMRLIPCQPGKLQDFYDVDQHKLGEGGFGAVRKAKCLKTGFHFAVKSVVKKSISDVAAFQKEFEIARSMDHPNIVKIYETFEDHRSIYLVMELCEGGELFDRICDLGHLTEPQAAVLVQQFCRALYYVHEQGVCHRDLKPENFIFVNKGAVDESPVKLIDFGLSARKQPDKPLTTPVGTAFYVAPEVLSQSYGFACDMWSVGVIMFCLLCGHPPFGGTDAEILRKVKAGNWQFKGEVWLHVSDDAKDLITKLLEMRPENRLTAEQALEHHWTKHCAPNASANHMSKHIADNLRSFGAQSQFKKVALNVIADQLDESKIHELKEAFLAIDTNNNGTLTTGEIRKALDEIGVTVPDLPEVVQSLDMDATGSVNYTEFIAASIDRRTFVHEDLCWHAFKVFDQDNDGRISQDELKKVLQHEGVRDLPGWKALTESIHEVDTDGDGFVEFDEFVEMMRAQGA